MQFRAPITYYRQDTPLSDTDLQAAQKALEISVPPGLRAFLLEHGCGMLSPNLEFKAAGRVFVIKDVEHPSKWGCVSIPGVLSFASSPFGDRYSISCRQQDYGIVYFEDHEEVHPDDWLLHTVCKVSLIPPQWVRGVTKIADSWEELESKLQLDEKDWVAYALRDAPDEFTEYLAAVGPLYTIPEPLPTPLISVVAEYGSLEQLRPVYEAGARVPDIVCKAVRNTREGPQILRYLLAKGEDSSFAYVKDTPYAMFYAKRHQLTDVLEVLREFGVPETNAS